MYRYKVKNVVKVIDGDTVDLELDLGFHLSTVERFRLATINTPERGKPGFKEAGTRLAELISKGNVVAETGKDLETFRRWLVTLYVNDININEQMISEGFGVRYVK